MGLFFKTEMLARGVAFKSLFNCNLIGRPIVRTSFKGRIFLGRGVSLMSSPRFCTAATLYSPCKLQTFFSGIIEIGDDVSMNGTSIVCRSSKITIGARSMIAPNVTIMDSPFHHSWPLDRRNHYPGTELDKSVEIGEDVWIGVGTIILAGAKIGAGSIIGAGSVVTYTIPPNSLAIGAPAKPIKTLGSRI